MEALKLAKEYVAALDDIPEWQEKVRANLIHHGCNNIDYFETKEGIITRYQTATIRPDIALLDINLDIHDEDNREGLDVCRFFKETSPTTTIVVVSSLKDILEEAKKSGADFFIQKKDLREGFDTFVEQYTNP